MAQTDVDVVLDQFAAVNDRDFARAMELYAGDVVLVVDPAAFLENGTFEGRDAVGRWFGNWFSTFEPGYRFEIEEAEAVGDSVLIVARHHGRGRSSGAEVRGHTSYVYEVRDGRIARVGLYADRAKAVRAAGAQP